MVLFGGLQVQSHMPLPEIAILRVGQEPWEWEHPMLDGEAPSVYPGLTAVAAQHSRVIVVGYVGSIPILDVASRRWEMVPCRSDSPEQLPLCAAAVSGKSYLIWGSNMTGSLVILCRLAIYCV